MLPIFLPPFVCTDPTYKEWKLLWDGEVYGHADGTDPTYKEWKP